MSGVRMSPLGTAATTGLFYQPQMTDDGECGATGGMKTGRGKPAPSPLCLPQIPHDQIQARTRAAGKPATNRLSYGAAYMLRDKIRTTRFRSKLGAIMNQYERKGSSTFGTLPLGLIKHRPMKTYGRVEI
jgi:hypothetical protein